MLLDVSTTVRRVEEAVQSNPRKWALRLSQQLNVSTQMQLVISYLWGSLFQWFFMQLKCKPSICPAHNILRHLKTIPDKAYVFYTLSGRDNDRWTDFSFPSIDFIAADCCIRKIRFADLAYCNLNGITNRRIKEMEHLICTSIKILHSMQQNTQYFIPCAFFVLWVQYEFCTLWGACGKEI
jgi:hypothetical protein